jgi:hypothetical protein
MKKSPRILFLNLDYPGFLSWLYEQTPGLEAADYETQLAARNASLFGVADFYSRNCAAAGAVAIDVHANNRYLQRAWRDGHDGRARGSLGRLHEMAARLARRTRAKNAAPGLGSDDPMFFDILERQVKAFRPDILYNFDMPSVPIAMLEALRPFFGALVGQIACPIRPDFDWKAYDFVISSMPALLERARAAGVRRAHQHLAFESTVLDRVPRTDREIGCSFVGGLSPDHESRLRLLTRLADAAPVEFWGYGAESLPPESILRRRHRGPAWGRQMYGVLARSKLTVNHHIDMAGRFANNMRVFEATGLGTCLITDAKENMPELFEPGQEVVTYGSEEECIDLVRYYLQHDAERERIAAAGQARCLRDHTYAKRCRGLVRVLETVL